MAKNTPHEVHKRVLSVFGVYSGEGWARTASGLGTPPTASGSNRPFYSNTNGSPSANSTLTMMMLTKPMLLKGWRPTSVTRSRKPTPEFMRSRTRERRSEAA